MASKIAEIGDSLRNTTFQGLWKLKDNVKIKIGSENFKPTKHGVEFEQMQETKKWIKTDIYLFDHETPVVKYCSKGAKLSSSTCKTIQLDDIVYVQHISKPNKPNVLLVSFLSYSFLISFKSKCRMELWMAELMCQTDIFSFLLYDSSDKSVKLGYYQLQFLFGKLVVCDTITKKAIWSWKFSQISEYHSINSSSVKVTVKDFRISKDYYFTGKRKENFCERLQIVTGEVQKTKSLESAQHIPSTSAVLTAHPFSKCSTMVNFSTKQGKGVPYRQYLAPPRQFQSCECLNDGANFSDVNRINHKMVKYQSSMEIAHCLRDTKLNLLTCNAPRHRIRHSKSLNSLSNDTVTKSLHKEHRSFNNLINSDEEEDYVIHSMYSRVSSTDSSGYLKLLPNYNDYEEIDDKSVNIEPDYCIIGGIDAY